MASKWEHLKGKVPDAPAGDMTSFNASESFKQKVEDAKESLSKLALPALMEQLLACNQEWDELESRKKELNVEFEALGQLVKRHFEQQGVSSVKSEQGKTFYTHVEPLISVKKGQREAAEQWVLADPARDYLWSIHPQSLANWVKPILEKFEDEKTEEDKIPEFIDVQLKSSIRVR